MLKWKVRGEIKGKGRDRESVYARYPVVAVRYNSTDTTRQDVGSECMNKSNPREHEREGGR